MGEARARGERVERRTLWNGSERSILSNHARNPGDNDSDRALLCVCTLSPGFRVFLLKRHSWTVPGGWSRSRYGGICTHLAAQFQERKKTGHGGERRERDETEMQPYRLPLKRTPLTLNAYNPYRLPLKTISVALNAFPTKL